MCSINDADIDGSAYMVPKPALDSANKSCRKCENPARVVLQRKDLYCRECFLAASTHKFRATLGKTKIMKPKDKVLVACSGSQSSIALLHLLSAGLSEEHHKKLLFKVVILYIDEGAILNQSTSERVQVFKDIEQIVNNFNLSLYVTSLSESLLDKSTLDSSLVINNDKDNHLINLFNNVKSMSSKEDLIWRLKQKLLINSAIQLDCNKIFTAEVANDLAVKLLSAITMGRGDQLPLEVGFCDFRHQNIKLLRPLRDFTRKEVSYYNLFHNLNGISIPSLTTMQPSNASIHKLTEKFVTDIQEDFPSTVYTIFRTGDKLSMIESDLKDSERICLLCQGNMKPKSSSYNAVDDTEYSKKLSNQNVEPNASSKSNQVDEENKSDCCGSCNCSKQSRKDITKEDLKTFFCYGCSLILKDMDSIEDLPEDILVAAKEKKNFQSMKDQISEFLL